MLTFITAYDEENQLRLKYQVLLQTIEETLITINKDLNITFISKPFLDKNPSYYIGKHISDFEFLNQEFSQNYWTWKNKNTNRTYSFRANPIMDHGVVDSILLVCLDVTDMMLNKENEIKLLKAETSLKSKIEFIASISHEIRNPLQAVGFSIDNLFETKLDSQQKDLLNDIKDSNKLASSIIDDILDISKIESGKMKLSFEKMKIFNICEKVIENNFHEAKKKEIDFYYICDATLPVSFDCDRVRFTQILNNFITNAIKYSEKGTIILKSNKVREDNKDYLFISVNDEGIGMSPEDVSKIFTPFEQFGKNNKSKGWGLGLSICKNLVQMLNGSIGVESSIGKGSTFWVKIPLVNPSNDELLNMKFSDTNIYNKEQLLEKRLTNQDYSNQIILRYSLSNHKITKYLQTLERKESCIETISPRLSFIIQKENKFKDKSILICEDNPIIHKSLSKLLNNYNIHNIESAFNGEEALDLIKGGKKYDIILMDVQMPKLNGIDASIEITKLQAKDELKSKIIICSGNAFNYDTSVLSQEIGISDILVKPISKECLFKALEKVIT